MDSSEDEIIDEWQEEEIKRVDPSGLNIQLVGASTLPDSAGKNQWIICGNQFDVDEKYVIVEAMGQGAYGVVVAAKDT